MLPCRLTQAVGLFILLAAVCSWPTISARADGHVTNTITIGAKTVEIKLETFNDGAVLEIDQFKLDTKDPTSIYRLTHWHPMDYDILLYSSKYIDEFLQAHKTDFMKLAAIYDKSRPDRDQTYFKQAIALMLDEGYLAYFAELNPSAAVNEPALRIAVDQNRFPEAIAKLKTWNGTINQNTLLVTHASREFDPEGCIQNDVNELIQQFTQLGLPVVYLMHEDEMQDFSYYLSNRKPTVALQSRGGEHTLDIRSSELTLSGGYFSECMFETLRDAELSYFTNAKTATPLRVNLPLGAIFTSYDTKMIPLRLNPDASTNRSKYRSLEETLKVMGKAAFLKYVEKVFTVNSPEISRNEGVFAFNPKQYSFTVYLDGARLSSFGDGPKQIELQLWTTKRMPEITAPMSAK